MDREKMTREMDAVQLMACAAGRAALLRSMGTQVRENRLRRGSVAVIAALAALLVLLACFAPQRRLPYASHNTTAEVVEDYNRQNLGMK